MNLIRLTLRMCDECLFKYLRIGEIERKPNLRLHFAVENSIIRFK